MKYKLYYTKQAQKDAKNLNKVKLKEKAQILLTKIEKDPFHTPPPYKALVGKLKGAYSRRLNIQHRIVYEVIEEEKAIKVLSMWSHYDSL